MFSPQPWGAESAQAVVQQRRRSETCSWEMQAGAGHTWEGGAHVGRRDEEENKGQREIKKKKKCSWRFYWSVLSQDSHQTTKQAY